jgi:hypothetical protein
MRRLALLVFPLLLATPSAFAASAAGNSALALAALVAEHSPALPPFKKIVMAKMLDGNLSFAFPAGQKILVNADAIVCRAGNVDISAHSCKLTFGSHSATISGRKAHELYATLVEVGVPSDGAAGTIFEALQHLACTIDPNEVKQKAGGGAD